MENQQAQPQVQQELPEVTLTVNVNTLNIILAGLDELPAKISRRVQDSLVQQAQAQLQQQPEGPLGSKVVN